MSSAVRRNTALVGALALVASMGVLQSFLKDFHYERQAEIQKKPEFIALSVDPRIIRRLLGVRVLAADLIWIDTLIKSDLTREGQFTPMYRAAKAMLALDPNNYFGYYVMGLYLSVIKDDVKGATDVLRDGAIDLQVRMNSDQKYSKNFLEIAWRVFFALGYNLLFEEMAIEEGAKWIREAAKIEYCPPYLKALAKRISTESGQLEVGARVLADLHRRAVKPEERKRIEEKLLMITVRQEVVDLNERFEQYLATTGAYSLPKHKAYQMFLRSNHLTGRDTLGNTLVLNAVGKITSPAIPK